MTVDDLEAATKTSFSSQERAAVHSVNSDSNANQAACAALPSYRDALFSLAPLACQFANSACAPRTSRMPRSKSDISDHTATVEDEFVYVSEAAERRQKNRIRQRAASSLKKNLQKLTIKNGGSETTSALRSTPLHLIFQEAVRDCKNLRQGVMPEWFDESREPDDWESTGWCSSDDRSDDSQYEDDGFVVHE